MEWYEKPGPAAPEDEVERYLRQTCSEATCVSNKKGFFLQWQDQISEHLTSEFMEGFAKWTSDEDRIVDVWAIKELHALTVLPFFNEKNIDKGVELRTKGNKFFQEKKEREAMVMYSQAITVSPPDVGDVLAVAYANRSAVLFHMKKYKLCLADIVLALESNYPEKLHFKVLDRQGQCYQQLKQYVSAQQSFSAALHALEKVELDNKKITMWMAEIKKRLDQCQEKSNENLVKKDEVPCHFFEGANPILPCASSAVELRYSKQMGRYCVASQAIPAGQVIFVEEAINAVIKEDMIASHCHKCFKQVEACVPCFTCCNVIFCSKQCRDTASATYHQWECKFVDLLRASGLSQNAILALRMITERGPKFFKDKEIKYKYKEASIPIPTEDIPYNSHDYVEQMKSLVGLEQERRPTDFLQRTLTACLLLKVLQCANFFSKQTSNTETQSNEDLTEDQLFVGQLLLRNLQILQFNAHEIGACGFSEKTDNYRSFEIAYGLYTTVSLLNHSCYPSIIRYFDGSKMVVVTVRPLEKGEMIAENYGPKFTKEDYRTRQRKLHSRYWFRCECEACIGRWPTYDDLEVLAEKKSLLCTKCLTKLPYATPDQPIVNCSKCSAATNYAQVMKTVKENEELFEKGKQLMNQWSKKEESISALSEFVNKACVMVAPPYRELHLAQDALRHLMFTRGNINTFAQKK